MNIVNSITSNGATQHACEDINDKTNAADVQAAIAAAITAALADGGAIKADVQAAIAAAIAAALADGGAIKAAIAAATENLGGGLTDAQQATLSKFSIVNDALVINSNRITYNDGGSNWWTIGKENGVPTITFNEGSPGETKIIFTADGCFPEVVVKGIHNPASIKVDFNGQSCTMNSCDGITLPDGSTLPSA